MRIAVGRLENREQLENHINIYTLAFLDYIWYSLDYTGNARLYQGFARLYQGQASTILGGYKSLYRDQPKDYTGIMAQRMEIRSAQFRSQRLYQDSKRLYWDGMKDYTRKG